VEGVRENQSKDLFTTLNQRVPGSSPGAPTKYLKIDIFRQASLVQRLLFLDFGKFCKLFEFGRYAQ